MIDDRACIDPQARIAEDVTVGPWSWIGPNVEIAAGCWIGPHVVIKGKTRIGCDNKFYQFSSIGEDPQDKKYHGEETLLEIGERNVIREFCTMNRGTGHGGGKTQIGSGNLFMNYAHIAHDCVIGNNIVIANSVQLAGHVIIDDYAIVGGLSGIAQCCMIGQHSFVAGGSLVQKDVLPFVKVSGSYASVAGINSIGLKRHNYSSDEIQTVRQAYKIIYRQGLTTQEAVAELETKYYDSKLVRVLIDAIMAAQRGIAR